MIHIETAWTPTDVSRRLSGELARHPEYGVPCLHQSAIWGGNRTPLERAALGDIARHPKVQGCVSDSQHTRPDLMHFWCDVLYLKVVGIFALLREVIR